MPEPLLYHQIMQRAYDYCMGQAAKRDLSDMTNHIDIGYLQSHFTWLQADADKRWRLWCLELHLITTHL
jgi:hypothetical protein